MLAQRISQHSARRLLAKQPTLSRFTPSVAIAGSRLQPQVRHAAFQPSATEPHAQTQPAKPSDAYAILAAQRLNRPISPT
ncbi:hypothetical protein HO173_007751 [Letharia columbiana]|uniref:Uncharacterized protein n=1 Tax=Letharia columbiana TaxID=112416 RepID=A0A8H6L3A3_9LECA|nr:uncharacterized protein HO173_007751 [Letharia columbiana]KAF6233921.1 hypothetical protein HO173_007751 [Letharia columbiana]